MKRFIFYFLCSMTLFLVGCHVSHEKTYDVIVVGSGVGGLSCAAVLAKNNYKVLVLEQHSQVGGFLSSYFRDGFLCSVGADDISGVYGYGGIAKLLQALELDAADLFVPHTRTFFIEGKKIVTTGKKNNFVEQVSKYYPKERLALKTFLDEGQKAFEEYVSSNGESPQSYPTFFKWQSVTYQQKLDEFFKNPDLKNLLSSLLGYIGAPADKIPASIALLGCLRYFIYGGYYPKGGPQRFVETLKEVITKHSGTVLTSHKVDQIFVNNNQISGVQTGDQSFFAPIVVANANAKTVFSQLIPKGAINQTFVDAIAKLKMSRSLLKVILGVDMDLSHFTSMVQVFENEEKHTFLISSNADKITAPKGKATISMEILSNYDDVPELGTPAYKRYKEVQAQKSIAKIEKIIPGLQKHIVMKDILTPRSFERITSMPKGAIYSFDQSIGKKRPYFKTPLKGLYLASASTGFGGGVEAVAVAGLKCASDILR